MGNVRAKHCRKASSERAALSDSNTRWASARSLIEGREVRAAEQVYSDENGCS